MSRGMSLVRGEWDSRKLGLVSADSGRGGHRIPIIVKVCRRSADCRGSDAVNSESQRDGVEWRGVVDAVG